MKNFYFCLICLLLFSCEICSIPFSYELADQFTVNQGSDAIAIDDDKGYIYVANSRHPQIHQYSLQGNLIRTIVNFSEDNNVNYDYYDPIDLTVDENSYIYILAKPREQNIDSTWIFLNGFCIIKYNSNGEYQKEFDYTEINEDWYPWRFSLAYKNNILYVTDGRRLKKINTENGMSNDFVFQIQNSNYIDPNYIHTTDMAIDIDNNIWLVGQADWDVNNDWKVGVHMTSFDSNCQNQKTLNANCRASFFGAGMNNPGITFDSYNNMYLATYYGQSIEIYDFDQEFQREIKMEDENSLPIDIVIDQNNNLYVLVHNPGKNRIMIYELDSY